MGLLRPLNDKAVALRMWTQCLPVLFLVLVFFGLCDLFVENLKLLILRFFLFYLFFVFCEIFFQGREKFTLQYSSQESEREGNEDRLIKISEEAGTSQSIGWCFFFVSFLIAILRNNVFEIATLRNKTFFKKNKNKTKNNRY